MNLKTLILTLLFSSLFVGCSTLKKLSGKKEDDKKEVNVPRLTKPVIRRIKIEGGRKGNRYVEEHYEWIIEKNSAWSQ